MKEGVRNLCEMHREKSRLQQGIAEDSVHTRKMNQTADGLESERWMGWYIDRTDRHREREYSNSKTLIYKSERQR